MMLLFLDTEITGLSHPASDRKLLSLALVAEDGSAQWYADDLDDWVLTDCDPWMQRHVLPLMTGPVMSRDSCCPRRCLAASSNRRRQILANRCICKAPALRTPRLSRH